MEWMRKNNKRCPKKHYLFLSHNSHQRNCAKTTTTIALQQWWLQGLLRTCTLVRLVENPSKVSSLMPLHEYRAVRKNKVACMSYIVENIIMFELVSILTSWCVQTNDQIVVTDRWVILMYSWSTVNGLLIKFMVGSTINVREGNTILLYAKSI